METFTTKNRVKIILLKESEALEYLEQDPLKFKASVNSPTIYIASDLDIMGWCKKTYSTKTFLENHFRAMAGDERGEISIKHNQEGSTLVVRAELYSYGINTLKFNRADNKIIMWGNIILGDPLFDRINEFYAYKYLKAPIPSSLCKNDIMDKRISYLMDYGVIHEIDSSGEYFKFVNNPCIYEIPTPTIQKDIM